MLVRLRVRRVRDARFVVGILGEFVEDAIEDLLGVPARPLVEDRFPRAETGRDVAPREPRLRDEQDRVHEKAVRERRRATWASTLRGEQGFDASPFGVGELMPVHPQRGSGSRSAVNSPRSSLRTRPSRPSGHPQETTGSARFGRPTPLRSARVSDARLRTSSGHTSMQTPHWMHDDVRLSRSSRRWA